MFQKGSDLYRTARESLKVRLKLVTLHLFYFILHFSYESHDPITCYMCGKSNGVMLEHYINQVLMMIISVNVGIERQTNEITSCQIRFGKGAYFQFQMRTDGDKVVIFLY